MSSVPEKLTLFDSKRARNECWNTNGVYPIVIHELRWGAIECVLQSPHYDTQARCAEVKNKRIANTVRTSAAGPAAHAAQAEWKRLTLSSVASLMYLTASTSIAFRRLMIMA